LIDKRFLKDFDRQIFFSEFTDVTLLKFTGFFHDIGKAYVPMKEGIFKQHDEKGIQIFKDISTELAFGKKAFRFCSKLIKNHLAISKLFFLKKLDSLTDKDLNFKSWRDKR